MFERWWDLDLGQRRVLAAMTAVVALLAVVTGAVLLSRSGVDHVALTTDQSTTTSRATTSSSSTTSFSVGAADTTSTGAGGGATSTSRASATSTTVKGKSQGGGAVTSTTRTPVTTRGTTVTTRPATTTTDAVGPCNPGGGNAEASQIADLFCSYRKSRGLATMTRSSSLDQMAQRWAEKMANDAALSHNPDYKAGVLSGCSRCNGWAENVAYDTSATNAWNGWLASPGHLVNIEDGHAGEYGVGAASGGGYLWFVQDFGRYP